MALLEVFVVLFIGLFIIAMMAYIAVIGRMGWQFFKYNFPMTKKRGTFYLLLQRDGRFRWIYSKFKSVWEWKSGEKSYISKKFDRISQTAEPLIFLVEGFPTNAMLSEQLPPEEMSRLVNNIIKEVETTSRLEGEMGDTKTLIMDKVVPIMTLGLAGISALIGLAIIMNLSEMSDQITSAVNTINDLRPQIEEALKTFQREI